MSGSVKPLLPLHEAVIQDDLAAVEELSCDPTLLNAPDPMGWTALELALLLGRRKCVKILDPKRQKQKIKVTFQGEKQQQTLTELQFSKEFGCDYLPLVTFNSYEELQIVAKSAPRSLKSYFFGGEAKRLASLYRQELWAGAFHNIEIRWIDSIIGYGLFTSEQIPAGTYIGTYSGYIHRIKRNEEKNHTYCFHYPTRLFSRGTYVIDSLEGGNVLRFANHSDIPNMEPKILYDRGLQHIAFFTTDVVPKGMQLMFNYGKDYWQRRTSL